MVLRSLQLLLALGPLVLPLVAYLLCHGAEAVATERMYSRSLQDVAQSIVRVEGVRRVIYLRVADISCTRGIRKSTGLSYRGPYSGVP